MPVRGIIHQFTKAYLWKTSLTLSQSCSQDRQFRDQGQDQQCQDQDRDQDQDRHLQDQDQDRQCRDQDQDQDQVAVHNKMQITYFIYCCQLLKTVIK